MGADPAVPATHAQQTLAFALDAEGHSIWDPDADPDDALHHAEPIQVSIAKNQGSVTWRGQQLRAFFYEETPVGSGRFQGLALAQERWLVIWLECDQGRLEYVWYESTDGYPMAGTPMRGTCKHIEKTHDVQVTLPASAPRIAYASEQEVFADGPELELHGAEPGWLTLLDHTVEIHPIGFVDCRDCGDDPGWFELHSLLWDREQSSLSFQIFYLFEDNENRISASYGLSLPSLRKPTGDWFYLTAHWRVKGTDFTF